MASRTGTVVAIELVRGNDGSAGGETTGSLFAGIVHIQNDTANTVIGGTDTLDVAGISTVITAWRKNGKTCTVRSRALARTAHVGTTSYAGTVEGTTDLTISPTAVSDYSANATLPANTTATVRPYGVFVTWTEA